MVAAELGYQGGILSDAPYVVNGFTRGTHTRHTGIHGDLWQRTNPDMVVRKVKAHATATDAQSMKDTVGNYLADAVSVAVAEQYQLSSMEIALYNADVSAATAVLKRAVAIEHWHWQNASIPSTAASAHGTTASRPRVRDTQAP